MTEKLANLIEKCPQIKERHDKAVAEHEEQLQKSDAKAKERRRERILDLGFFEKEYAPDNSIIEDYPYSEWDANEKKTKYFKKTPFDLTEEELAELEEYINPYHKTDAYNDKQEKSAADKLGRNIAQKLKMLALVLFVIECIGAFIGGIVLMGIGDMGVLLGFGTWIVGAIAAYVSFMFLYAFGELVETNQQIARNTMK